MSFLFCKVDHHLEVVDRASMTFRSEHKFLIEAKEPSRFLHRDYFWTGSGAERETLPEVVSEVDDWGFPQHRIHGPLIVEGNARILVVDLGRTLTVGEQTTVHFLHKMKDLKSTFKPMLRVRPSSLVRDQITLKVTVPNWSGLEMHFRQFTHDTEKVLVSRKVEPQELEGGRLAFEVVIVNPNGGNLGHKLEWTHDET
ncbi:hypothetical protein EHH54_13165 [Rhizobium leguminosarum]|uniref:hypothetical protein n=1 Tax=Rhizobium leguminosarum TaxID=384 RepID=UPI000FEC2C72|nr:hypothetical protein [Rhizobium leguminosarum]RWX40280.1 hypothetical protein EHH54_13165 [Rhizobium leguminosarum]